MAFKIFPTSIAGIQLPFNQLKGPLSRLWQNDTQQVNLFYPQDIGNNPAHCHVVQISIYEYTSELEEGISRAGDLLSKTNLSEGLAAFTSAGAKYIEDVVKRPNKLNYAQNLLSNLTGLGTKENAATAIDVIGKVASAKTYRLQEGQKLATISLYMPDTLNVDFDSNYSELSLTKTLGAVGTLGTLINEMGGGKEILNKPANILGTATAKSLAIDAARTLGGESVADIAGQALHQVTNPQIQLLYQGIGLREFNLDFVFTPKSSYEAEMTKQIVDSLIYYSSPGIAGLNTDDQQQFLTPPQLFNIKFLFTGKNGIEGSLGSIFNKALTKLGLDFLVGEQNRLSIDAGQNQNNNIFSIGECVLKHVHVDYAPNGWAAFDDGHPIQTKVSLRFQEINIMTKERLQKNGHSPEKRSLAEVRASKALGDFMG